MKVNVLNNINGKIKSSDIVHGNNKIGKTLDTILNNNLVINERGSNINGEWVKYENGTLVYCYKIPWAKNGGWYQDGNIWIDTISNIMFPQPFVSPPTVTGTINLNGSRLAWISFVEITTQKITKINIVNHWNATACSGDINLIAIGKWK